MYVITVITTSLISPLPKSLKSLLYYKYVNRKGSCAFIILCFPKKFVNKLVFLRKFLKLLA